MDVSSRPHDTGGACRGAATDRPSKDSSLRGMGIEVAARVLASRSPKLERSSRPHIAGLSESQFETALTQR